MASKRLARRQISAAFGGAAIIAMVSFTAACSDDGSRPEESPTTTTNPSLTPTEKSIRPTGGHVFTPPVKAPQQTVEGPND